MVEWRTPGMVHDPMCPRAEFGDLVWILCDCHRIKKVREMLRADLRDQVEHLLPPESPPASRRAMWVRTKGYQAAIRDVISVIDASDTAKG